MLVGNTQLRRIAAARCQRMLTGSGFSHNTNTPVSFSRQSQHLLVNVRSCLSLHGEAKVHRLKLWTRNEGLYSLSGENYTDRNVTVGTNTGVV